MATEEKARKIAFEEAAQERVLRPDFDAEDAEKVFAEYAKIVGEHRQGGERRGFFDARDSRVMVETISAMSADTPAAWGRYRGRIMSEYPSIAYDAAKADIQQRVAEQLVGGKPGTVERVRALQKRYAKQEAVLGSAGPEGLAACFDLFMREKNGAHDVWYPDTLLDVLYKVDFVAHNPDREEYLMMQVKTYDSLDDAYMAYTPADMKKYAKELGGILQPDGAKRDDEMQKLSADMSTLEQFTQTLARAYREQFTPLFLALPSFRSAVHPSYFDKKTGLPKKDFPAIMLPAAESQSRRLSHI